MCCVEETAGTGSQEYYLEQEKELFAIRQFFYKHNLLPKDDSYFPDDVIEAFESLQAENKRLRGALRDISNAEDERKARGVGYDIIVDVTAKIALGDI